jgi:hypothetical protein
MALQTATNPQTGERVALVGDSWQPILQSATNKEGAKAFLVGDQWLTENGSSPRQNVKAEPDRSLLGFAGNVGSSGLNLLGGIGHAVMHPLETTKGVLDVGAGALQNVLPKSVVDTVNKIDTLFNADPEAAKRAVVAADAMGGVYKEKYGSWDKIKNTLYTDPVGAAADLSTILGFGGGALKTVAGAAKVAGAPEMAANVAKAIAPVETMANVTNPLSIPGRIPLPGGKNLGERAAQVGGAITQLPGKATDYVGNVFNPKEAALLKMTEGQAPAVIEAIRNNPGLVEGYNPSVAERASELGLTKLAAAEREVKPYASTNVLANDIANRNALLNTVAADTNVLSKIEGKPKALTTLEEIRKAEAKQNYGNIANVKVSGLSDVELAKMQLAQAEASKGAALRDWGKFATEEAQQRNLAAGGVIPESLGGTGNVSPSAYPVPGYPRIGPQYTENAARVPEYAGAAKEAMAIADQRGQQARYFENALTALKEKAGADKSLQSMLSKPSMKAALNDALLSAQETGTYFPAAAGEKFSVANLQRIKESLDANIAAAKASVNAGKRPELSPTELTATKNQFIDWLGNKVPEWKTARETYAEQSKPINRMEIRQELAKRLMSNKNPEGKLQAGVFENALAQAHGTIKKATGEARYEKLSDIFTSNDMKDMQNVSDELARTAKTEEQASRGAMAGKITPASTIPLAPGLISKVVTITNTIIRKLQGKVTEKVARDLAMDLVVNPEQGAIALEKALAQKESLQTIKSNAAPIKEAISAGAKKLKTKEAATIGRISNALAPEQQNQNALAR